MHRYTGYQRYQYATWNVFDRTQYNCIVQERNVREDKVHMGDYDSLTPRKRTLQTGPINSYLIGETFKYAYLKFGFHAGELPLEQLVGFKNGGPPDAHP